MTRPDDIPQDLWDAAERPACRVVIDVAAGQNWDIRPTIARAIMAERERCAAIADAYAEVNWEQCTDSILLDPVLSNKGERPLTKADWEKAEDMAVDGTIHSSMYHAATNIAAAIRTPSTGA